MTYEELMELALALGLWLESVLEPAGTPEPSPEGSAVQQARPQDGKS